MNIIEAMDKYPEAFKRPGDGDLTDSKVRYWIAQVLKTRRFGSTYIHADKRDGGMLGGFRFGWESYGRSVSAGGHKHKAYVRGPAGEIVRSVVLREILSHLPAEGGAA